MKEKNKENIWEKIVLFIARTMYRPKVIFKNKEVQDINLNEPMVIICNHTCKKGKFYLSEADGPIIREVFKNKNVCSLAAKDIMEKFPWKYLMQGLKCIPVDRGGLSLGWIRDCEKELKNGNSVIIFPEGTTLKEKAIDEFHSGFVTLAKKADVKVLPIVIYRDIGILKEETTVYIGVPEKLSNYEMTKENRLAETQRFRSIMANMYCQVSGESCDETENLICTDVVKPYKKSKI